MTAPPPPPHPSFLFPQRQAPAASALRRANAKQPQQQRRCLGAPSARASRLGRSVGALTVVAASPECPCEVDPATSSRVATVNGRTVAAPALAALSVVDPSGAAVNLGEKMGSGKAVLVMLRHLG